MKPPEGLEPFEVWFDSSDRELIRRDGLKRYDENRRRGHQTHHEGVKGPRRDELGVAGEMAGGAFLAAHGIGYKATPMVTRNWEDITQDLVVDTTSVGCKGAGVETSWEELWKFESFLYPDKKELQKQKKKGTRGLTLDYPDHLLAVAVVLHEDFAIAWVVGAFEAFDVIGAPTTTKFGPKAHQVPLDKIVELETFLDVLRGEKEGRPD